MPPETIAQIAGLTIIAVLVAALCGTRWGARRERGRLKRSETLSMLRNIREENTRNFDEMRDRLRHIESRIDTRTEPAKDAGAVPGGPAPPPAE